MFLAVDVGNTNITFGVFKKLGTMVIKKPVLVKSIQTKKDRKERYYILEFKKIFRYNTLGSRILDSIYIASVVPEINKVIGKALEEYFKVKPGFLSIQKSIKVKVKKPQEVGDDRLCNAYAAYDLFKKPCIVIDFGTATTFDCIGKKGEYVGGVIAPGPNLSSLSLHKFTSKLPMVKIEKVNRAIGRTTIDCMRSGLYFGYIGLVKEILKHLKSEMPKGSVVVATGGLSEMIVKNLTGVKGVYPHLTLEGIRLFQQDLKPAN